MVLLALLGAGAAGADNTVTYTATQTIPVPPASDFAGSAGGDGWAVAMTPTAVYNVFHHASSLRVACHLQTNAKPCWGTEAAPIETRTITDTSVVGAASGSSFATSGQPGLWLDQGTGRLYVFAMRTSDSIGGVVCIDTTSAPTTANPFCGFTALTGAGEAVPGGISDPAVVGSRWFAFNYVSGAVTGARNALLCFDLTTFSACAGQPFAVGIGSGAVSAGTFPAPAVAAIGNDVIVPITIDHGAELACFDGTTLAACAGTWPVALDFSYPSANGAPFPLLTASGSITGLCLPGSDIPCYSLSGASVATPQGMTDAIFPTSGWNGPAFVLGPRVYVPNGNRDEVDCYDYNLSKGCTNFPKSLDQLGLLYTVNADPQRPACIWVNADNGAHQIQNFDAFTGGACGAGAIRVLASSSVVGTPLCTPGSWTSLQVTAPARNTYASGSVAFQDASGIAIPGATDVQLDNTGTASLSGLNLAAGSGLPQFLITLAGAQGTSEVVVQLTWTGAFDPSCTTKPGTTVVNPPSNEPSAPAPAGSAAKADVKVAVSPPTVARTGKLLTFTVVVSNSGPNTSTGVVLRTPVPASATLVSASSTVGNGCTLGTAATCFIGTLVPGGSATVTMVFLTGQLGPFTISPTVQADYDTNSDNNSSSTTTTVVSPTAPAPPPPPPAQPGTYNAVGTGTIKVNGADRPADLLFVLSPGDVVDVTNGMITIRGFDGGFGVFSGTQDGSPSTVPSQFTVSIVDGVTVLTLVGGDFSVCSAPRSVSANGTPIRQLWGSAKGKFRTTGRYASATVRGTVWLIQDRCDGTFTSVVEDIVDVADLPLAKTTAVGPGQSYLAKPPAKKGAFKPPVVKSGKKIAQIKRVGLVWAGRTFKTRAAFEAWLVERGSTWQAFKSAHPALAAALASRR